MPGKISQLYTKVKAELTSFGGSAVAAAIGFGLQQGGAALAQTGGSTLAAIGAGMTVTGNALQMVAAPAAIVSFGALAKKFGQAWAEISRRKSKALRKQAKPAAAPRPCAHFNRASASSPPCAA